MQEINGAKMKALLEDADKNGYAIPMFDYADVWDQMAIIEAAEELKAPVMFATLPKCINEIGIDMLGAMGRVSMARAAVPAIHHLDHCNEVEMCKQAVDQGFPSVMIDASKEDLETNIRMVKEVVEYAHLHGSVVEAEIGRIKGRDYEGTYLGDDFLVKVEDAVALAQATGVDSLAIGIGTAHGFYQGKPEINFKRLAEVNEALSIPLVLHGGTGIPEEDVRRAIKNGINKVNVGTQIRCTYMNSVRETVEKRGYTTHTIDIMHEVRQAIKREVQIWIKTCMADGKADNI